jgi:hypothetical protein
MSTLSKEGTLNSIDKIAGLTCRPIHINSSTNQIERCEEGINIREYWQLTGVLEDVNTI